MSPNVPSEKRTLLALALASGTPVGEAADQAGICRKTVQRWLAKPAFRRLVSRIRGQMLATALGYMTDNMTRAARTVAELLDAPEAHVRLRAARTLMSFGLRFRQSVDLTDQVHQIERELARKKGVLP
jgi:nicotinic acid phosphoribosyltransferase